MNEKKPRFQARDLRGYARQTSTRIIIGALFLLLVVGDGLIYVVYGKNAAILGLICILGGLMPVVMIILIFVFLEWVVRHNDRD